MSGSQTPAAKPPKEMSSRLRAMKFMRRAAASASPIIADEPSPKRRKSSPPASPVTSGSDPQAIHVPQEVLDRLAAEVGETHWKLSFQDDGRKTSSYKGLRVVGTGFAGLDDPKASESGNDDQDGQGWRRSSMVGRKSFGNFKRASKDAKEFPKVEEPALSFDKDSAPDSDSDSDDDDDDEDHPVSPNNRRDIGSRETARRRAMKEAKKEAEELKREKKLLRGISSISGGGGQGEHQQTTKQKDVRCYKCGKSGHIVRDCTNRR